MRTTPRTFLAAGAVVIAGLAIGGAALPALAAQDPVLTEEQQATLQAQADAFKACLERNGATLPEKPADGSRPTLSDEQRAQLRAAFEACADERPSRPELSDAQRAELRSQVEEHRACVEAQLDAAGIVRPERPADGSPGGPRPIRPQLTDEQKAAIESARAACEDVRPNLGVEGIGPLGGHGHGPGFGGPGRPGGFRGPGSGPSSPDGQAGATQTSSSLI